MRGGFLQKQSSKHWKYGRIILQLSFDDVQWQEDKYVIHRNLAINWVEALVYSHLYFCVCVGKSVLLGVVFLFYFFEKVTEHIIPKN